MSKRASRRIVVGQDIAAPLAVASGGKIPIRSESAAKVARWFGLGRSAKVRSNVACAFASASSSQAGVDLAPGTVTLICGPSGAGKSSLLRELRARRDDDNDDEQQRTWIDLNAIALDDVPIVDCFEADDLQSVLKRLARVGLGEAWSYLRTPGELSEGQRFRLKLAIALHRAERAGPVARQGPSPAVSARCGSSGDHPSAAGTILVCDEFAALLDRLTAMIVARCLRNAVDRASYLAAVVATSHDDLLDALSPDVVVRCDFGKVEVEGAPTLGTNAPKLGAP